MTEPKLCPDCPLFAHLKSVKKQSWTRTLSEDSTVHVCSKLRALAEKWGWPSCPYFPKEEKIKCYL